MKRSPVFGEAVRSSAGNGEAYDGLVRWPLSMFALFAKRTQTGD
jgi:hypothetical protein